MKFDIAFIDVTAPKPYTLQTMLSGPLGGTESAVIRVAEGLGAMGYNVGVFQEKLNAKQIEKYAFYLPFSELENHTYKNVVSLRSTAGFSVKADKHYVWHHDDVTDERLTNIFLRQIPQYVKVNADVIGVSQWHKGCIQQLMSTQVDVNEVPKCHTIYAPVPDALFVDRSIEVKYDKNQMVWAASPHKGLDKALDVFRRLRVDFPELTLHVFNPGYLASRILSNPGVVMRGGASSKELWDAMASSICLFYPTTFKETFGLIAAEANAVHTPVLMHRGCGALSEVVHKNNPIVEKGDIERLAKVFSTWYAGDRPRIVGKSEFKLSEVLKSWVKLLERK